MPEVTTWGYTTLAFIAIIFLFLVQVARSNPKWKTWEYVFYLCYGVMAVRLVVSFIKLF